MKPLRILLLGRTGQLGWELHRCLALLGDVRALDVPEIDLTNPESVRPIIRDSHPDLIVNATAYTDVDRAESEPDRARMINGIAPGVLAEEAASARAALLHFSTDYVFSGESAVPYTEQDPTGPINVYGQTKLEGEQAVAAVGGAYLILRTSWLYSLRAPGFLRSVLQWGRTQPVMRIVSDQTGSPTWSRMLAQAVAGLVLLGRDDLHGWAAAHRGVYHLAGLGSATRLEWARLALELDPRRQEHIVQRVEAATSTEFPGAARRPAFSALDCGRFVQTFGMALPDWKESLRLAMDSGRVDPGGGAD